MNSGKLSSGILSTSGMDEWVLSRGGRAVSVIDAMKFHLIDQN